MLILLLREVLRYKEKFGNAKLLQHEEEKKRDKNRHKNKEKGCQHRSRCKITLRSIDGYLTAREAECVALMMVVQKEQIIADYLGISIRTVDYYLRNAARRFECRNFRELIDLISNSDFYSKITEVGRVLLETHHLKVV